MAQDLESRPGDPDLGVGPVHMVLNGILWIGRAAAWILMPILVLVLISVVLSMAKVGTIFSWDSDVFLFGFLQWLKFGLLAAITLFVASFSNTNIYTIIVSFCILVVCQLQYTNSRYQFANRTQLEFGLIRNGFF